MAPGLRTALAALFYIRIRAEDAELSMGEVYHGMLDTNEDGRVNKPELDHFVREMLKMSGAPHLSKDPDLEPVLEEAWRMSDENGDGDLSEKEAGNTNAELNSCQGAGPRCLLSVFCLSPEKPSATCN